MIRLDAATVLLQWATGGLFFLWITTRRRELGIGYGWLLRSVYGVLAVGAFIAGRLVRPDLVRDICALATAGAAAVSLVVSIARRKAGVSGQRVERQRKAARVVAMVGNASDPAPREASVESAESPPWLDLVAPVIGGFGLLAAALAAGGPHALAIARTLVGAAFLGSVTDAMLLGHWYLVQPGLGRAPIFELIRWLTALWPIEVAVLIWPTGMLSVLSGSVDDGWNGTLGWFWVACAVATVVLVWVTKLALKEKEYSAVMAATGLLYLAILTAFGTDLVARAVLTS
ncbi:MAG: hypothetical protein M3011_06300 [Actinomycetota bacterium]|nr:hypothetical protein [Actinomycetota bacterium]